MRGGAQNTCARAGIRNYKHERIQITSLNLLGELEARTDLAEHTAHVVATGREDTARPRQE